MIRSLLNCSLSFSYLLEIYDFISSELNYSSSSNYDEYFSFNF